MPFEALAKKGKKAINQKDLTAEEVLKKYPSARIDQITELKGIFLPISRNSESINSAYITGSIAL
ncbi:hypothetical protein KKG71_04095 [Patescibacteria group bacterium]|nr:hypothetical protein [Patescibacteria group bacterium]